MPSPALRFLHAGDFHLERPLAGLDDVPEHLRELFLTAAFQAAELVFDAALAEEVDFVVLSGDLVHFEQAGPRGAVFLLEQFQRLADAGMAVYWAGGRVDPPDAWPAELRLPSGVHRFPAKHALELAHERRGQTVARLIGRSRSVPGKLNPADYRPAVERVFTIAVGYGRARAKDLQARPIDYWALGGRHQAVRWGNGRRGAHWPGTTQGRSPREPGAHGCTLVEVDAEGRVSTRPVPTDVVRWEEAVVTLDSQADRDRLAAALRQTIEELAAAAAGRHLMVSWSVRAGGALLRQLCREGLADELLERLRGEYGRGSPAAWSVSLQVEPCDGWDEAWAEQETLLGDFLRTIREYQLDDARPIDLASFLDAPLPDELPEGVAHLEGPRRERLLCQAALLGADLLSGEVRS